MILDENRPCQTHPAGSVLMEDFGSTLPTPLEKNLAVPSDCYRIMEKNTLTVSTVSNEEGKDGGTSYSGRDRLEEVIALFKKREGEN